jgi:intein/homing endonuclease
MNRAIISFIKKNYRKIGCKQTAESLGISIGMVTRAAQKLGISLSMAESCLIRDKERRVEQYEKYSKLLDFNNDISVYLLGFIWADGYVSIKRRIVAIQVAEKDKEISDYFSLIGDWKIRYFSHKLNGKIYPACKVSACSVELATKLAEFGFETKSYSDLNLILQKIPKDKQYLFFRGYFDGDGCLSFKKIGSYKFTIAMNKKAVHTSIVNFFKKQGLNPVVLTQESKLGHSSKTINFFRKEEVKNLLKWVYSDNLNICLKRKYDKYVEMIAHIDNINYTKINPKSISFMLNGKQYFSIREASKDTKINRYIISDKIKEILNINENLSLLKDKSREVKITI